MLNIIDNTETRKKITAQNYKSKTGRDCPTK